MRWPFKDRDMLTTINQLTTHYSMRSVLIIALGKNELTYVEYGSAPFVNPETKSVVVDEPLVLLAATHRIPKPPHELQIPQSRCIHTIQHQAVW